VSQRSNTTKLETAEFTEVDFDANLLVPECEIQDHRNASDNSSGCQGHRIKDATSSPSSSDKLAIGGDAAVEVRQPLPELTLSPQSGTMNSTTGVTSFRFQRPGMEFMKVKFRWGFWRNLEISQTWGFYLRFCLSTKCCSRKKTWFFFISLIVQFRFLKP
jgi:hypothetical protein